MPYVDRQNRICGFLDIEENETCGKFLRRYFILDTQANCLLWYMDNPQTLNPRQIQLECLLVSASEPFGSMVVNQLQPKAGGGMWESGSRVRSCRIFAADLYIQVINALSQRYFLQASDQKDLQDWVEALNRASKITNGGEGADGGDLATHPLLRRSQSYIPTSASKPSTGPPILKSGYCVKQGNVRKSWKRRYFALDDFTISYFKCEQDKEPLRSILLKDVLKTHECLVKSGDLLMRDNLFEIITSSRTFYIQADSPEDMHSWIKAITGAMQALKSRPREMSFMRSISSMSRPGGSNLSSSLIPSLPRMRHPGEERKALCKTPSTPSWQPWTPVPQPGGKQPVIEEMPGYMRDSVLVPSFTESDAGAMQQRRVRHRSEPQHIKEKPFVFNLDDENIRTSDV
ncbi:pleckstrin homology domain-containing family A member 2 isoform X1 [Dermochelys coriacea]|uniref:pleckstrin homology domain-containing family A member 2 isoform X1 n=1 Tax=Dermochelys coriacea TaxID=27794 RepID=UPI001CA9DD37|nr:pleckstrin homology domain-containing family A member 2 isoform X1 [Dermochelys coriacea]